MDTASWQEILIRLLSAFIFGSAVGIEKKWYQTKQHIQSNAQIALGAGMFSILASSVSETQFSSKLILILSISIFCAGIFSQKQARLSPSQNINIVIKLWCAGAIGSLVGYGFFVPAYISILLLLITNLFFPSLEKSFNSRPEKETKDNLEKAEVASVIEPAIPQEVYYQCYVNCLPDDEAEVLALLVQLGKEQQLTATKISSKNSDNSLSSEIGLQIDFVSDGNNNPLQLQEVLISLKSKLKVTSASWTHQSLENSQNN